MACLLLFVLSPDPFPAPLFFEGATLSRFLLVSLWDTRIMAVGTLSCSLHIFLSLNGVGRPNGDYTICAHSSRPDIYLLSLLITPPGYTRGVSPTLQLITPYYLPFVKWEP